MQSKFFKSGSRALIISLLLFYVFPFACLGETSESFDSVFDLSESSVVRAVKVYDPLEGFNRKMFKINCSLIAKLQQSANKKLFKVTSRSRPFDNKSTVKPVKQALFNIMDNLSEPSMAINHLLQGHPENSVRELWRFFINSTLGIFGTFDIAGTIGLEKRPSSYKQTLALYGIKSGPFLIVPLLGATSLRNSFAAILEILTNPLNLLVPNRSIIFIMYNCDKIARGIKYRSIVFENNIDPYAKLRTLSINATNF
ncbi:vacJ like lipofamily protein [Neorickettsia helminthoeca str. Oregon]|uniref:VacJ like lipofamily protein n=1 Tax=Neorickettsia helminthoeca str. Oregon TaxID=1286528 RepID=X5GXM4_9RICK|nr:VacJ family lipoprotein [Neorickettsia helminthoeca]AHX11812.1 vacJ like lipofamily protein [Neorickettsia helminthoeca str. Oregon]